MSTTYAVSLVDVITRDADLSEDQARAALDALRAAGFGIYETTDYEGLRRRVEFIRDLSDQQPTVFGHPWQEAFEHINGIVGDPV